MPADRTEMKIQSEHMILFIDDCPEDVESFRRAIEMTGYNAAIRWCEDSPAAMDYLVQNDAPDDERKYPLPDIVFLDLNMPGMDGRELLSFIKGDAILKKIPIVVFTSSKNEIDVYESYQCGANSYICKPNDFKDLIELLRGILHYWFEIVMLPGDKRGRSAD